MTGSLTQRLAAHIAGVRSEDIPADVRRHASWIFKDLMAVMLDATTDAYTTYGRLIRYATAKGTTGPSRIFGSDLRTDVETAAHVGGMLGYAIDNEAHHTEAVLHPVAAMGPVVLAVAEAEGRTGRDAMTAFILGIDVSIRVSEAFNAAGLYDRGFHPTPVSCGFGAAAATAWLMGLDADVTRNALGLAGAQASGLLAWVDDPQEQARPMNVGIAARNGVAAARMAAAGLPGYPWVFESKYSVLRAFSDRNEPERLVDRLGEHWTTTELVPKLHACVAFTHPALDALQELVEHGLHPGQISSIEMRFPRSGYHVIDNNPLRSHCAQYLMALMATRGVIRFSDVVEDRMVDDLEVARIRNATTVVPDDELDRTYPELYRTILTVELNDGHTITRDITYPLGHPENPVTEEHLSAKFDRLVVPILGEGGAWRLSDAALGLEDAPEVGEVLDAVAVHRLA